jgi:multidrug transporter EmrE-like cation transporter
MVSEEPIIDYSSTGEIKIIRAKIDSLSVFEVTETELSTLEHGSPSSIYLNFAIFLFSIGFSTLISFLTLEITSIKIYSVYLTFSIVGIIGGSILFILWYREKSNINNVIKTIKNRAP